ncbi:DUF4007 family protein [Fictibacillus sp. KIGAM418]|uniref:DUF4007 family protein n=1 Tax=Fictibacillus marinisediminis TaxID=2878389 RepID=A0A9X2BBJ2_9BACL|nr:DUF4007 family protein [Fictibacillus marinisediminis]MCK6255461.1 DUF4007 family protein [Fictibacillus marinisediminis]
MGFGQHQTFYLRQQWITKGLTEIKKNPRFFYEPEHFEILGVGKNMAKSIRHWLNVTQLIEEKRSIKTEFVMTDLAKVIFQYDPYIKTRYTLYILHYLLVTEKNEASTWYWFFNVFNERVFSKQMLVEKLKNWVEENFEKEVSLNSLKRDVDCLIQLYTAKEYINQTPEDVIKSPFESLGLIHQTIGTNFVKSETHYSLISNVLYITLLRYSEKHNIKEVSLNDLINGEELWGKVFNLNRDAIIEQLEEVQKHYPVIFTRTNRLDVIRLNTDSSWLNEIKVAYKNEVFK